jgi:fatty acid desaturase
LRARISCNPHNHVLGVLTLPPRYVFDYLPHRPHAVPYKQDPYKSTSVVEFLTQDLLTIPLLSQNMHNIHHMYPYLPFYRYGGVWHRHKDELKALGTRVVPWLIWGDQSRFFDELPAIVK